MVAMPTSLKRLNYFFVSFYLIITNDVNVFFSKLYLIVILNFRQVGKLASKNMEQAWYG